MKILVAAVACAGLALGCGPRDFQVTARGTLYVVSGKKTATTLDSYAASAEFTRDPRGSGGIAHTAVGPCLLVDITVASVAPSPVGAGTITIFGGKKTVTLLPDAMHGYSQIDDTTFLWLGGETITLSATGDTVPAFSLTAVASSGGDLVAPPAPAAGAALAIDRMSDLTLRWTGGGEGVFRIALFAPSGPTSTHGVVCPFPSRAGTGVIPKEALATLPQNGTGTLELSGGGFDYARSDVAGDYSLLIGLATETTWSGTVPTSPHFRAID